VTGQTRFFFFFQLRLNVSTSRLQRPTSKLEVLLLQKQDRGVELLGVDHGIPLLLLLLLHSKIV